MTIGQNDEKGDRELWRRAREGLPAAEAIPDDEEVMLLAAYLDGSLGSAAHERVEAWLASDPQALELMMTARAGLEAEPTAAPDALLSRAQGLVRERKPAARAGWLAPLRGWLLPEVGPLWQPIGLAAMLLVVCALGFQLGRTGYAGLQSGEQPAEQQVADLGLDSPNDDIF